MNTKVTPISATETVVAGMPHLDIYTLSEDYALGTAAELHWKIMAASLGMSPSRWIDTTGARMYCGIVAVKTWFDLENPITEDDEVTSSTALDAIRKPHALSTTTFSVGGTARVRVTILSSFIKRSQSRSNKRFSKVNDLWTAEDLNPERVEAYLDEHHEKKSTVLAPGSAASYTVNRINDFNYADFMYFKNYVRISKAHEWVQNRDAGGETQLNAERACYYFGNVADGEEIQINVSRTAGPEGLVTHIRDNDRLIFLSIATPRPVTIPDR